MFEQGSDMENLILKVNVGSEAGIREYTIDAIKYVDGTDIKDVDMRGERTVKVGIYSAGIQPTASVTNEIVGINESSTIYRIEGMRHSILILGDLSVRAENDVIENCPQELLKADYMFLKLGLLHFM